MLSLKTCQATSASLYTKLRTPVEFREALLSRHITAFALPACHLLGKRRTIARFSGYYMMATCFTKQRGHLMRIYFAADIIATSVISMPKLLTQASIHVSNVRF